MDMLNYFKEYFLEYFRKLNTPKGWLRLLFFILFIFILIVAISYLDVLINAFKIGWSSQ